MGAQAVWGNTIIRDASGRDTNHGDPSTSRQRDAAAKTLWEAMILLPAGDPERDRQRCALIELYQPLAEHLTHRFRHRHDHHADLVQVACLALVKAVDGFDPARGVPFSGYAVPMILGELKRYFRDRTWDVRAPRPVQELRLDVLRAADELVQLLGRSPTVRDIARHLGIAEEVAVEGFLAAQAYHVMSLNAPTVEGDGELIDELGGVDAGFDQIDNSLALRALVGQLPGRQQQIIALYFYGNLSQAQIAARLGISQMHVSRLLTRAVRLLREGLLAA